MFVKEDFKHMMEGLKGIEKSKIYIKPGEEPPEGVTVMTGPKGGQYYDMDDKPIKPKDVDFDTAYNTMMQGQENEKTENEEDEKVVEETLDTYQATKGKVEELNRKYHQAVPPANYDEEQVISNGAAVEMYAGHWFKYINQFLRGDYNMGEDMIGEYKIVAISEVMEKITRFLESAPKMSGRVYRGMGFSKTGEFAEFLQNVDNSLKEGTEVEVPCFWSTTIEPNVVRQFMMDWRFQVELTIDTKEGVPLDGFGMEDEQEVLLQKGKKFKVRKVERLEKDDLEWRIDTQRVRVELYEV
jgi:hypothetical protein